MGNRPRNALSFHALSSLPAHKSELTLLLNDALITIIVLKILPRNVFTRDTSTNGCV